MEPISDPTPEPQNPVAEDSAESASCGSGSSDVSLRGKESAVPSSPDMTAKAPHATPGSASGSSTDRPAAVEPSGDSNERVTPAEMVATINAEQDAVLDKAVADAIEGITDPGLALAQGAEPPGDEPAMDSLVTGRIANIGSEDVLLDFGSKSLGVMPRSELDAGESYEIGAQLEVLITGHQNRDGLIPASRKKAKEEAILRNLEVGRVLEGRVSGMNRGGLEMDIEGLRAFMPSGQVDLKFVKDISNLIGQVLKVEVLKFDRDERDIIVSRRKVQIRESAAEKEKVLQELEVGQIRRGKVQNLTEFGAFVDIGGVDGLLHVSDMSWGRVRKPEEIVKLGDEIDVKIIKISPEKKKISLSLKQIIANPWDEAASKYPRNTKVSGRVVRLANFGAFVELEPGLDALLPISEMSWTRRVRHPKEVVKEGDVIEAAVVGCDPEKHRISVSLKALRDDPWSSAAAQYEVGTKVKGKVVRTTEFGAFVSLEDGIDGLIHISELSEQRIRAVTDKVKEGEEVEVRILNVDSEAKKIALSLRAPPPEPSPEEIAQAQAERKAAEKRRNKNRRGGITFGWDQGLGTLDPSKFAS